LLAKAQRLAMGNRAHLEPGGVGDFNQPEPLLPAVKQQVEAALREAKGDVGNQWRVLLRRRSRQAALI
jgi:hypothetical protein